jgi:NAD(P)-dependent dehydrogenase (short-subunit alcohol dehydrogenase family)
MGSVIVIGAGPGIGAAVARRFAREGRSIALVARKQATLDAVAGGLPGVKTFTADSTDEASLRGALDGAERELGPAEAVIYNAAIIQRDEPGELPLQAQLDAWAVNVVGALTAAAHLAPGMARRGGGSVLITGGMPAPDPRYTSLSLGKAGVRALVDLLAQQWPGVHVASVTVAGAVAPGTAFDPDDIAEHYWRLHTQLPGEWQREIVHGAIEMRSI